MGLARAIGPLVKYFRATGDGAALELAIVLKEKAHFGLLSGGRVVRRPAVREAHPLHNLCDVKSLAQLAT